MNQVSVLLNHLVEARDHLSHVTANSGAKSTWMGLLDLNSEHEIAERMNSLSNTAIQLCKKSCIEGELEGITTHNFDTSWLSEVLRALSLYGNFSENVKGVHNHTYSIIRTSIRSWDNGYTVQTSMDQDKINDLISRLEVERNSILFDEALSFDLKKILLIEIDKIVFSLKNLHLLGEENLKNNVTDFYANAFFNKDIQNYYQNNSSFKEVINDLSATITIGSFAAPNFVSLVDSITNSLPFK